MVADIPCGEVEIHSKAGSARVIVEDPHQYIQRIWAKFERFYENRFLEYVYWHYKGRVFVDVGSNVGNHTLFFAKFCEPSHVISVEPVAASVDLQRRILALNGVNRRVTIHEVAVSDAPGRGRMEAWDARYPSASMALVPGDEVEVTTLDLLLADVRHVNLMKVDVEGNQLQALYGAAAFLQRERPVLFVEFLKRKGYKETVDFLAQYGYRERGFFQDASLVEFAA